MQADDLNMYARKVVMVLHASGMPMLTLQTLSLKAANAEGYLSTADSAPIENVS